MLIIIQKSFPEPIMGEFSTFIPKIEEISESGRSNAAIRVSEAMMSFCLVLIRESLVVLMESTFSLLDSNRVMILLYSP